MSILNEFSEGYERFITDSMLPIIQTFLSNFVSAYRKHCSANHEQTGVIENWEKNLHNNKKGAVFMDLSKAFDCIPHDLLIAKMEEAYGFSEDFLIYLLTYFLIFIPEALKTIHKH